MAHYERRKGGWSVRWRDPDGTSRRRQVPTATARDKLIREIEDATGRGRRWEPVARRHPAIVECVGEYLREMKRVWRPNTLQSHSVSLSLFIAWVNTSTRRKHIGIDSLSKRLVGDFWDHCREARAMSVATANLRARSVEQFWLWCWDHDEHGPQTPRVRKLRLPSRTPTVVRAPSWAEMDAMIEAHTTEHHRRLCWLMRCTGLRKEQAFGLRWSDVDMEAATLLIRPELGKTQAERSGRVVPLAPVLLREIAGWGVREGWLLPWGARRKAHNITLQRAWERAGIDEEKWKQRTAHAFRKRFVSGLIGMGANREAVEFLVGHSMGIRGVYTDSFTEPLPAKGVAMCTRHRDGGAGFVDDEDAGRVDGLLPGRKGFAFGEHVRLVSLRRYEALFLCVTPKRARARPAVRAPTMTPVRSA